MALSKDAILAAKDTKLSGEISVPEWGGSVYVKTLTGTERDAFEDAYAQNKMKAFRCRSSRPARRSRSAVASSATCSTRT